MISFVMYLSQKPAEFVEQILENENFVFISGLPNHAQNYRLLSDADVSL